MYNRISESVTKQSAPLAHALKSNRSRYTFLGSHEEPRRILLHKARFIITENDAGDVEVLLGKSVLIEDGVIKEVFDENERPVNLNEVDVIYDGEKRGGIAVTPGLINCHTHPPMYLLRSSLMLESGENLEKSLHDMFKLESLMTEEDFFVSTIGDLTEEQKNGITTTLSHYAVFEPIEEAAKLCLHNVINAISAVSNSHPKNTPEYVEELLKNKDQYFTQVAVAIHYAYKAQPEVLKRVAEIVNKYGTLFTLHAAETKTSVEHELEVHGDVTVKTLEKVGLAHDRTILSHGVHLTDEEIDMIKKYGMGVVHLPTSNQIHKSGEFPFEKFVNAGAQGQIALGTDSVISKNSLDLISEALQTRLMHQDKIVIYYEELFKMMTSNAARMLHLKDRGRIAPGYKADLCFWKVRDRGFMPYDESNPVTLIGNMITHGGRDVRDLMIDGQFVISNRRHNLVDETELLNHLQRNHQELRKRYQAQD